MSSKRTHGDAFGNTKNQQYAPHMYLITVGHRKEIVSIHEGELSQKTNFFEVNRDLENSTISPISTTRIVLKDHEPQAFNILVKWIYNERIVTPKTAFELGKLIRAYVLAWRYDARPLQNEIIDNIRHYHSPGPCYPGKPIRLRTLTYLMEEMQKKFKPACSDGDVHESPAVIEIEDDDRDDNGDADDKEDDGKSGCKLIAYLVEQIAFDIMDRDVNCSTLVRDLERTDLDSTAFKRKIRNYLHRTRAAYGNAAKKLIYLQKSQIKLLSNSSKTKISDEDAANLEELNLSLENPATTKSKNWHVDTRPRSPAEPIEID